MDVRRLDRLPGWAAVLIAVVLTSAATAWIFTARADSWRDRPMSAEAHGKLTAVLLMSQTGGIAGLNDLVVVRPSGLYVVQFGGGASVGGHLTPGELQALAKAVARADLRVARVYGPGDVCCDIQYDLYSYGPRSYESGGGVPERMMTLRSALEGLINRNRSSLKSTP